MRNSSLVERPGVDNKRASRTVPKLWICIEIYASGRGAFHRRGSTVVMLCGGYGKANVGISNDKAGEKPAHRKTKVS